MLLKSKFSKDVNPECPLEGHPDPYWRREEFLSLNGKWEFSITQSKERTNKYEETILVPFAVETPLSGINRRINKNDYLHYRKEIAIPDKYIGMNGLLRFMAVDQETDLFINGEFVLCHEGGYSSFSYLIQNLKKNLVIELVVHDDTDSSKYARGKQMNDNKGIWYTPTSGIYQEVYLEFIPSTNYIESCKITPDFSNKKIRFNVETHGKIENINIQLLYKNNVVGECKINPSEQGEIDVSSCFYPWSPDNPNLYEVTFSCDEDVVHSVTAIRSLSFAEKNKRKYLLLNGEPIFLNGLLDQGYTPDGGLTWPSLEAMKFDIQLAKSCGFNLLRKHIKVEQHRWYYLCDSLGMVVMQDIVNGGARYSQLLINLAPFLPLKISDKNPILGRINDESKEQFKVELKEIVGDLYNVPSILAWTLFNEGWGQFDTKECLSLLRGCDSSRLIDATSGWYDKKIGDFYSRHIYFRPVHLRNDKKRLMSLSEFGGYSHYVKDHSWSDKTFGYKTYKDLPSLQNGLTKIFEKEVRRAIKKATLCVSVYTQLTDVEDEVNGLVTYDREIIKVKPEEMKKVNDDLQKEFQKKYAEEINKH